MSRVEGNVIVHNYVGLELDTPKADLGGGTTGSLGGNVFSCNTYEDISDYASPTVVSARNNQWDHVPPTIGDTADLYAPVDGGTANLDIADASVAASACP